MVRDDWTVISYLSQRERYHGSFMFFSAPLASGNCVSIIYESAARRRLGFLLPVCTIEQKGSELTIEVQCEQKILTSVLERINSLNLGQTPLLPGPV